MDIQPLGLGLSDKHKPDWAGIRHAYFILRRRRRLFFFVLITTIALSIVAALIHTPKFTATARVVFDPREENVVNVPHVLGNLNADSMVIDTQVEIIRSRAIVSSVVAELDLSHDPEFDKPRSPSILTRINALVDGADLASYRPKDDMVSENVGKNLSVRGVGLSSVLEISFQSKSPSKAIRIADAFAEAYIADQLAIKAHATDSVGDLVHVRLEQLRSRANDSDAALRQFQASHGLVGLQSATGATAIQQEISSLTQEYAKAQTEAATARARSDAATQSAIQGDAFSGAMLSPVLQDLKKRRSETEAKISQLKTFYQSDYPPLRSLQNLSRDISAEIERETNDISQALLAESQAAQARATAIKASLADANKDLQAASLASVVETQLRNQAEADRSVYQSFLDRSQQTSALAGTDRADARIISHASSLMTPNAPSRKLIVAFGLILGCAAGLAIAAIVEFLGGGIYGTHQLTEKFNLRLLGSVPEVRSRRSLWVGRKARARLRCATIDMPLQDPDSLFSEMLRAVTVAEPFDVRKHRQVVVLLTSSVAAEGKSTTSVALARTLALQGVRVLLVDCDLSRRGATKLLGGTDRGIGELVNHEASFEEVVRIDERSGLRWIGVATSRRSAGLFAKPQIPAIMTTLRNNADLVLLDSAPLLATADSRQLATVADRVLVVLRWAKTQRRALRAALAVVEELGVQPAGVLLTRVDLDSQRKIEGSGKYAFDQQYFAYRGSNLVTRTDPST